MTQPNINSLPYEIWKDISGYEGYYQMNETSEVTKLSQEAVRQYILDHNVSHEWSLILVQFLQHFDLIRWMN